MKYVIFNQTIYVVFVRIREYAVMCAGEAGLGSGRYAYILHRRSVVTDSEVSLLTTLIQSRVK